MASGSYSLVGWSTPSKDHCHERRRCQTEEYRALCPKTSNRELCCGEKQCQKNQRSCQTIDCKLEPPQITLQFLTRIEPSGQITALDLFEHRLRLLWQSYQSLPDTQDLGQNSLDASTACLAFDEPLGVFRDLCPRIEPRIKPRTDSRQNADRASKIDEVLRYLERHLVEEIPVLQGKIVHFGPRHAGQLRDAQPPNGIQGFLPCLFNPLS